MKILAFLMFVFSLTYVIEAIFEVNDFFEFILILLIVTPCYYLMYMCYCLL